MPEECDIGCDEASFLDGFYDGADPFAKSNVPSLAPSTAKLNADLLQICIDECAKAGFDCYGNRLNGENSNGTSSDTLSCADGCEIAYYSKNVTDCKEGCASGESKPCEYKLPLIEMPFSLW